MLVTRIIGKLGLLLSATFCLVAISSPATGQDEKKKKLDKKVYSKFDLVNSDQTAIDTTHSAEKGRLLFETPVYAKDMVELTAPAIYRGLGSGLGIAGPKKEFRTEAGAKFFKVFSEQYEHIYCEVGRYKYFDNCLIDLDGDSVFDLGANKHAQEAFVPGEIFHEDELEQPAPYISADKTMPLNYSLYYYSGSKRPKLISFLMKPDVKFGILHFGNSIKAEKGFEIPYGISIDDLEMTIIAHEDKVITVEITKGFLPDSEIFVRY